MTKEEHAASESSTISRSRGDITICRDEWGIPAISASNNYDLFFGNGYAVAEDRLFQIEIIRREAWGRMAEILGEKFLERDKRARILGARCRALRKARTLSSYFREILEGYAAGINAHIESHNVAARQGFRELDFVPELWTVEDIMTCSETLMHFDPVDRVSKLIEKVGLELTQQLYPVWPPDTPVIVPESEMAKNKEVYERLKNTQSSNKRRPAPIHERSQTGSNNCVVTGSKSTTGKPILLGDPQMTPPRIPQRLHEVVLHGGDFHCRGASFPSRPGIIVGFNRHAAWAITGLGGNRSDFYEEKFHPDNLALYLYRGRWEPVQKRTETIKVKDGQDVTIEARSTHHGPICGELFGIKHKLAALRHVQDETNDSAVLDYLRINAANSYDEFRDAVSKWEASTAHLIYADREGNIAYWPAGAFPLRPSGHFWGTVPGWNGEYEWDGFVPFEDKPALLNPDQDFIVTANNLIVSDWYPYNLITRTSPGPRFQRIREILMKGDKFNQDDMENVVRPDITCTPEVRKLVPLLIDLVTEDEQAAPELQEAANRLSKWDYRFSADSVAATIFGHFVFALKESIFRPRLGDDFNLGANGWEIAHLSPDSPWFDDPKTPEPETRDDALYKTFRHVVAKLAEELGPDQEKWTWDSVSCTEITNQLTDLIPDAKSVAPDFGKFTMEGCRALTPHPLDVVSYSQVVDLTDMDKSRAMLCVGNSELFDSPHSHDQIKLWIKFKLRPAYLSEDKVVAASKRKLLLQKQRASQT